MKSITNDKISDAMIGWDFSIFWEIGKAVLEGQSPYIVEYSRYPPATAFFFTLFGLLPFLWSFAIWSGVNVILYISALRRFGSRKSTLVWLLFTPFLFNLLTGQVDILFFWVAGFLVTSRIKTPLSETLNDTGWKKSFKRFLTQWAPALAAVFITLKPQLAAVILPWFLLRWLFKDRTLLLGWLGGTIILHSLPLLYDPNIYAQWINALKGVSEMKMGVSSGIFAFRLLNISPWLLGMVALSLSIWGLTQPEQVSRPTQLAAFPLTIWYDDLLLAGNAPSRWMVPISWLAFLSSVLVKNSLPLVIIPFAALAWQVIQSHSRRFKDEGSSLDPVTRP